MTPNLLCDNCVHNKVCRFTQENNPAKPTEFCVDQLPEETVGFIRRAGGLRLSDIAPYITCEFFTVIKQSGETCNNDVWLHPLDYLVDRIDWDNSEQKIVIIIEPVKKSKSEESL